MCLMIFLDGVCNRDADRTIGLKCFGVHSEKQSFTQMLQSCSEKGINGSLAVFKSLTEAQDLIMSLGVNKSFHWIGIESRDKCKLGM